MKITNIFAIRNEKKTRASIVGQKAFSQQDANQS